MDFWKEAHNFVICNECGYNTHEVVDICEMCGNKMLGKSGIKAKFLEYCQQLTPIFTEKGISEHEAKKAVIEVLELEIKKKIPDFPKEYLNYVKLQFGV